LHDWGLCPASFRLDAGDENFSCYLGLGPGGATTTGGGANGGYSVTGPGCDSICQDL
jgi:hypothetical protein